MIYGLYNSAAGMMTNEYRQSVVANNLANAETAGFKRDVATFAERMPAELAGRRDGPSARDLAGLSGGMWLGQTHTSFAPGPLQQTGNHTDVALDGPGFLVVEKDGESLLTRDGRLMVDVDGRLVSVTDGAAVLNAAGRPVRLNPRGGEVSIDRDGRISQGGRPAGQLALTDVADYAALDKVSAGRFRFDQDQTIPAAAALRSGFVEHSSVNPIKEMVSMIEATRTYQLNAQMLTMQDQSVGQLLSVLS